MAAIADVPNPTPMQLHELSLRQTEHIAIYGGFDGSSVRGDLLEIDPGELTWSSVDCSGTGCRVVESLLVAGSHQCILSAADTLRVRLLCKDPEPNTASEQLLPEPRFAHGAATLPSSTQPFGKVSTHWPAARSFT